MVHALATIVLTAPRFKMHPLSLSVLVSQAKITTSTLLVPVGVAKTPEKLLPARFQNIGPVLD